MNKRNRTYTRVCKLEALKLLPNGQSAALLAPGLGSSALDHLLHDCSTVYILCSRGPQG